MNNLAENADIIIDKISKGELHSEMKTLKSNKAPGVDLITAELRKHEGNIIIEKLNEICIIIWNTGQILLKGGIVNTPIKGSLSDCSSWQGTILFYLASCQNDFNQSHR